MKDTKAIKAAKNLKNYCMQTIGCNENCIFYIKDTVFNHCKVGMPWAFDVEGVQDEKFSN